MREEIIKALKNNDHISGEELARQLKISRTAIWKHINELRKQGYEIHSSTNYGYKLLKNTDLLIPEEVSLKLETSILGKQIVYRKELTSTQDIASKLAIKGAPEGSIILAEKQTSGRGRKGRPWISPPLGGLYVSIILKPEIKPFNIIQLPLVVGVAVARAIKVVTQLPAAIKWPNDIFIGTKKVAGILAEVKCNMDSVDYAIIGIGVNINTRMDELPLVLRNTSTSLSEAYGQSINRIEFLCRLLSEIETVYSDFVSSGYDPIRNQWRMLDNTIGSTVLVNDGKNEIVGKAIDIDEDGFLLVKTDHGTIKRVISADVSILN